MSAVDTVWIFCIDINVGEIIIYFSADVFENMQLYERS